MPTPRAVAARQLELAAQWMDEAAVHTIHGWSQRMLGQHAFDSGYAFEQNVSSDESELLGEAVRDYWRQHFFRAGSRGRRTAHRACGAARRTLQKTMAPLLRQPAEQLRVDGEKPASVDDLAATRSAPWLQPLRALAAQARTQLAGRRRRDRGDAAQDDEPTARSRPT